MSKRRRGKGTSIPPAAAGRDQHSRRKTSPPGRSNDTQPSPGPSRPLAPRPKLFVGLLVVLAGWIVLLVVLALFTVQR